MCTRYAGSNRLFVALGGRARMTRNCVSRAYAGGISYARSGSRREGHPISPALPPSMAP